jgi:heme-degrading monooxygenase HmoA
MNGRMVLGNRGVAGLSRINITVSKRTKLPLIAKDGYIILWNGSILFNTIVRLLPMIFESAVFHIKKGKEQEFEAAFKEAVSLIASVDGYISHTLNKSMEDESSYMVIVVWDSVESHMEGFVQSELFEQWKEKMDPFFEPNIWMNHFQTVQSSK